MTGRTQSGPRTAGLLFFLAFVTLLLAAPLYKGGNRPLPLALLELGSLGFLLAQIAVPRPPLELPRALWIAIALLLGYPLIQLIPMPHGLWATLPGHAEYATVIDQFASRPRAGSLAISVLPAATEYGWLALLPPLACLLAAMRLSPLRAAQLLLILSVFAGCEAVLGLMQVGAGIDSPLYLGNRTAYGAATGTFVNRNHLAAMLAMSLPVMVGLLVFSMRPGRRSGGRSDGSKSEVVARRALLFGSALLVLLCLIFTRSRTGIATAMVGLVCSAIVLVRARAASEGSRRTRTATIFVLVLIVLAVIAALAIGVTPILERIEAGQLRVESQGRMAMYGATLRAAIDFLPLGSGLSTFADVFPRFRLDTGPGGYVDHAHNEYLQALLELGVLGPVVIALLLYAWASRMMTLLWREGGRSFTLLQLGAGLALLPMILHSVFDFALHMPANAMWFATLAGVMFHKGVEPHERRLGDPTLQRLDTITRTPPRTVTGA